MSQPTSSSQDPRDDPAQAYAATVIATVQPKAEPAGAGGAPPATLEIVSGGGTQRHVGITSVPLRIGRGPASDLVLSDGGVSRAHAEIVYEDGSYGIRDVGSSNGTFVDGERIQAAALRTGQKIELGRAVLMFEQQMPEVSETERLMLMGRSDLLRAHALPVLAAAATLMSVRRAPKGGVVLRQGAPMEGILFVHRGALRVVEVNDEGGERVVGRVEAGGHFGERALVAPVSAPHTLIADQDVCVLGLTMAALERVIEKRTDDSGTVARTVLKKIQTEQRQLGIAAAKARRDDLADLLVPTAVEIVGEDKRLLRAKERLATLAKDARPILIVGPQGSGKRLFARHAHQAGPHRDEPYVEMSLSDRGLGDHGTAVFGQEADPAVSSPGRTGLLETIGQGTLTIAHAELLDPHLQVQLADYLRLGWFRRVGGREAVRCQARVVLVATGDEAGILGGLVPQLRERVEGRVVASPSLAQRLKDIPLLADHYLAIHAARAGRPAPPLSREAVERLVSYAWPGNVRELENVIQRAVMVATQANIIAGDLIFVPAPEKERHTRNLLRDDRIREFLRRPGLMSTLIGIDLVFVAFVTAFTLYGGTRPAGHPLNEFATNPGMLVTWLVWFPLLPVSAFLFGRVWCGVCPIAGFGDLASRLARFNLPVPAFLKRLDFWLLAAAFVFVDYVEELFGVADRPWATAVFLVVILYLAAAMTVLYERKAFCKYLCPLAGILGAYSSMSILEIRGNRKVCQSQCGDHSCHKGTAEVPGCPLFAYPASINTNAECMMCLNCVKSCDHRGLQLNLRPPFQELWRNPEPMMAMSVFAVALVGLMAKHQFPKLTWWLGIQQRLGWSDGAAHTILFLAFALLALAPFLVTSVLSAAASRERVAANAAAYGVAFLPLAFAGHLAHLSYEFLSDGVYALLSYVVKAWDALAGGVTMATNAYAVTPFVSPPVVTFIGFLIVFGGLVGSVIALVMIARRRSSEAVLPRVLPHLLLLSAMWVGYLVVFTGSTEAPPAAPAVGAAVPGPPGGHGGPARLGG